MISPAGNERLEPWTPFSPCTSATLSLAQKARCSLAPVFVLLHVSRSDYKILKAWQGKTGPGQQGTVCTGREWDHETLLCGWRCLSLHRVPSF